MAVLLLLVGLGVAAACWDSTRQRQDLIQYGATLVIVLLAAIPAVTQKLSSGLDRLRHPSEQANAITQLLLTGFYYLLYTADTAFRPPTPLRQFLQYYKLWLLPQINAHANAGFWKTVFGGVLPSALKNGIFPAAMLLCVPLGFLALWRRRWAFLATFPLFVILYACYPFIQGHYMLAVAPALIALVLAGCEVVRRWSNRAGLLVTVGIGALCLTSLHEINPTVRNPDFPAPLLVKISTQVDGIKEPAIVLFQFWDASPSLQEPVYNVDVA